MRNASSHDGDEHCDAEQKSQDVVVDRDEHQQPEWHPDVRRRSSVVAPAPCRRRHGLCSACHVVTKMLVSELTTTATFGSIASVISGTDSNAKPKPATICMNAAMNTATPTTISWAVVTSIDSGTAGRLRCGACCRSSTSPRRELPREIDAACREFGFFAIRNHGVSDELREAVLRVVDRVLRAQRRREGTCRSGARRTGVAWVVSARWRADVGRARPEGGLLLRSRAAGRDQADARPQHLADRNRPSFRPLVTRMDGHRWSRWPSRCCR